MLNALRLLGGLAVVASLGAIAVTVVAFVVVAIFTVCRSAAPDPLSEELDRVLAEILTPDGEGRQAESPRRGG